MDLALDNLQGLICHKIQTTNPPIFGTFSVGKDKPAPRSNFIFNFLLSEGVIF